MINLIYTNSTRTKVDKRIFSSLLPRAKGKGEVSLTLVGEAKIQKLNKQYRKKNTTTDVITFAYSEGEDFPGQEMLGEIYICLPIAKKQAKKLSHSLNHELKFLFIHGLLHLFGYTHETDEKYEKMMKKAEKIMG